MPVVITTGGGFTTFLSDEVACCLWLAPVKFTIELVAFGRTLFHPFWRWLSQFLGISEITIGEGTDVVGVTGRAIKKSPSDERAKVRVLLRAILLLDVPKPCNAKNGSCSKSIKKARDRNRAWDSQYEKNSLVGLSPKTDPLHGECMSSRAEKKPTSGSCGLNGFLFKTYRCYMHDINEAVNGWECLSIKKARTRDGLG